jgi:ABC-type iron transport system FetAB permease component
MPTHSYRVFPRKIELIIHAPIPTGDIIAPESLREAALNIRRLVDESKKEIESSLWDKYKSEKL